MNDKQFGKWLATNIACQDDRFQYLGSRGISRKDISVIIRSLVDGHYIDPANYDKWDFDRELKNMDVSYWATREDYAENFMESGEKIILPDWIEIDLTATADNLLRDVNVIELNDNALVTFNEV